MKRYKESTWQHEATGEDGHTILFGVNIFDYQWINTHRKTTVLDPLYQQQHNFPVYVVEINGIQYEFAAGEFSNCVWGFYTYRY